MRTVAGFYIETIRNVPLLVQLFFWYFGVFQLLPLVCESIAWPGSIFFNNHGLYLPWASQSPTFAIWFCALLASIVITVAIYLALSKRQSPIGRPLYTLLSGVVFVVALSILTWFVLPESPLIKDVPTLGRFNFEGGMRLSPEFSALLAGLVFYTGTFIAEIVRSGIQSVNRGQVEAAKSLGLNNLQALRLVIFPQALRVIIPPLISQLLNLMKNSSLAIAIGFPNPIAAGRIMINQAGRAIPIFVLIMISHLVMNLTYSIIGNIYNRRVKITER
jgi:general L-amino acid transport system permease protein